MHYFVDSVLRDLEHRVLAEKPEHGGALLGLPSRPVITEFLFDEDAEVSAVSFHTSNGLGERVREMERSHGLQFKGIAHSHPGGLDRPSGQDRREAASGLALNPHLADYALPILTLGEARDIEPHELSVRGGKLSCFLARRACSVADVVPVRCAEIPLGRDLAAACLALGGQESEVFVTRPGPELMIAGRISFPDEAELMLLITEQYPLTAPMVLLDIEGSTEQLHLPWQLSTPPEERLVESLGEVLPVSRPWAHGYGPWRSTKSLTTDRNRAQDARWAPTVGTPVTLAHAERVERQAALAPLKAPHVFLVGAGSVGSVLAEVLVRSGVTRLTVCDPDDVDAGNLSRTIYEAQDVGSPKVTALKRLLLQIDPDVSVTPVQQPLEDVGPTLPTYLQDAQLAIAATDDPEAQRRLNAAAYSHGVPAIFPGLYAGADGGEVVFTLPERTACFLCAKAARNSLDERDPEPGHDYGTGRLLAQVALGADIQHLTTAAAKLALGLIAQPESPAANFVEVAVGGGTTYLTMGMSPDFWFYPAIFGAVPSQYAYQSVWLAPTRQDDCPVCGKAEYRRPWDEAGPSVTELQAAIAALPATERNPKRVRETTRKRAGRRGTRQRAG